MTPEEDRLAEEIRRAFRGVSLGNGIGLLEGQGLDDYADAETLRAYRTQDEREDWTRLPVAMLNACHSSLSFFDAEGMRFHLPAYLVADLEGTMNQDIIFYVTYLDERMTTRFGLLNGEQREAVREFLLLRLSDPDYAFESGMIEAALDFYWMTA